MAKTSIQYIKEAAKKLVDSKLQRLDEAKTQEIFRGVMQTVGLESIEEVYLFVAQFDLTFRDRASNMNDLSNYFKCSSLDMIEYIPALKSLERKGLLVRRRGRTFLNNTLPLAIQSWLRLLRTSQFKFVRLRLMKCKLTSMSSASVLLK